MEQQLQEGEEPSVYLIVSIAYVTWDGVYDIVATSLFLTKDTSDNRLHEVMEDLMERFMLDNEKVERIVSVKTFNIENYPFFKDYQNYKNVSNLYTFSKN